MTKYFQNSYQVFTSGGDIDVTASSLLQTDAILSAVYDMLENILGFTLKPSQKSLSLRLGTDYELDSRDVLVLLIEVENYFCIEISQDEELEVNTIHDLLNLIQGKL